ncbi:hypothetical protein PENSPDRAFT_329238 [Peniophora sp. CONT]|nr:hypothetical protein PENSPDRAFT_329238 [Peniophora sp. CONT]
MSMKKGEWQWFADKEIMAMALQYLADPANHPTDRGNDVFPLADSAFRHHWLCMSIMTVHALLQDSRVRDSAAFAVRNLASVSGESQSLGEDAAALKSSSMLDMLVKKAWHAGRLLRERLDTADPPKELFTRILEEHDENISELEYCWNIIGWAKPVDDSLRSVIEVVSEVTEHMLPFFPGATISTSDPSTHSNDTYGLQDAMMPHFLLPVRMTSRLAGTAWRLRDIQAATWDACSSKPDRLIDLSPAEFFVDDVRRRMSALAAGREGKAQPFREQLWRLHDLAVKHGGTLYVLDLLFNAMRSGSAMPTHPDAPVHEELYAKTFRAVISNWRKRCDSLAFQAGLVAILRDVLWSDTLGTVPPLPRLPLYIIEEMLQLITNVFSTTKHPHAHLVREAIDAVTQFSSIAGIPKPTMILVQELLVRLRPPMLVGRRIIEE